MYQIWPSEYQLSRQKEAAARAEKREQEKLERQQRLAKTIRDKKEKQLSDKVKYNWVDSDDEEMQGAKKSKKVGDDIMTFVSDL